MSIFDWEYAVEPDVSAGVGGVYSGHVKYVTTERTEDAVDVWISREWLGPIHPKQFKIRFEAATTELGKPWYAFELQLRKPGQTRREYASVETDDRGGNSVTGVYVDYASIDDPPPVSLVMWIAKA